MTLRPELTHDYVPAHNLDALVESDIGNNSLLFLSLTQSRQAWTTALFRPFIPSSHVSNHTTAPAANHEAGASNGEPELVGSCTVVIGPHMFPDTRFFRFPCQPSTLSTSSSAAGIDGHGDTAMAEGVDAASGGPYQLAFEFRENPTDRWLLPEDAVIEALTMSAPYEIIATFRLPSPHADGGGGASSKVPGQHITMHFSEVSEELWQAIRAASGDQEEAIQRLVKDIQVNLDEALGPMHMAFDRPPTLAEILGSRTENDDRIALYGGRDGTGSVNPAKLSKPPKKRASDANLSTPDTRRATKKTKTATGASPKKAKKSTAASTSTGGNGGGAGSSGGNGALHDTNGATTPTTTGTKKCMYCNCKNTPMWRRGPQGAGTLCNACGVKWKHGKILQGVTSSPNNGGSGHSAGARSSSSSPATADDHDRSKQMSKAAAATAAHGASQQHSRAQQHGNDSRSPLAPLQRDIGKSSSSPESEANAAAMATKKSASASSSSAATGAHASSTVFVPAPLKKRFSVPGKER
ncbi:hypothetical protein SYNPS1DRAFT_31287 [Syncephalis pseudoplumigaleata]|uniref:GATA-type domain-containing protein n=1 Tax=Syncephalis pseudoplumigaleata TaxID=1712513 RepID=A0A4V1J0W9_9FUNG|nr:hypothetical protein SYNPS1DRAFT_31287 [Syncephalis pseudoplumigaleata]|eukprot:RKP23019.1 hypothetical protein SYNPS1DRAFT_31287 [Syncephalis pseudoplumigaleata]